MATENRAADGADSPKKRPYHPPRIVKFGSIESLPDASPDDAPALADPRLQLIIERWTEIPESIKEAISDTVREALD
ncbi:hypothetical protein AYO47_04930 [Planctomyces sp. SCGC AG-212-M04]|nr:hypothetical protein AYO47_04930 [Planctomyces sp. SCGC AG-212-M04]